jgi:hypothetical protein
MKQVFIFVLVAVTAAGVIASIPPTERRTQAHRGREILSPVFLGPLLVGLYDLSGRWTLLQKGRSGRNPSPTGRPHLR